MARPRTKPKPDKPSPQKRATRDPAAKRQRILDAAAELFGQSGYRSTGTADIARRANVSEGLIFHHFGNKRGVLLAMATEHGRAVARVMLDALMETEELELEPMLRSVFTYVSEHRHFHELVVATEDPEDRMSAAETQRAIIVAAIRATLTMWSEQGRVRTERLDIAASLLYGIVETALNDCFMRGDGTKMEAYVREATLFCENAISGEVGRA